MSLRPLNDSSVDRSLNFDQNQHFYFAGLRKGCLVVQMAERLRYLEHISDKVHQALRWKEAGAIERPVRAVPSGLSSKVCQAFLLDVCIAGRRAWFSEARDESV